MISERSFSRAFNSFWSELLPLLTPQFVSLFNEAYQKDLCDRNRRELVPILVKPGTKRLDIIAEFAFRLAQLANQNSISIQDAWCQTSIIVEAEKLAFQLIQRYDGNQSFISAPLTEMEMADGFLLCSRYDALFAVFPENENIEFCPKFNGSGFLNSCEGDIGIGTALIEVKTTTRRASGSNIKQLISYLALDANTGRRKWSHIGLFNPRRGTFHYAEIDLLILRLSGGKPTSDVLAELIRFVESNETRIDHNF